MAKWAVCVLSYTCLFGYVLLYMIGVFSLVLYNRLLLALYISCCTCAELYTYVFVYVYVVCVVCVMCVVFVLLLLMNLCFMFGVCGVGLLCLVCV